MDQSKDYFVVVQTKEAGKHVLTAVPNRWIRDGYLFWPCKSANKLRKNLHSEPNTGWSKIACSIKRKYIPSYEEAEIEAAELSGQNTESSDTAPRRKKQKKATKDDTSRRFDFNHLVPGDGNPSASSTTTNLLCSTEPQPTGTETYTQSIVDESQIHPGPSQNLLCSASVNPVSTQHVPEPPVYVTTVPISEAGQHASDEIQAITADGEYLYFQQPTVDVDYIVKAVTDKIETECAKMKQEILAAIGSMMASFKSEMDVKLAAALRAQGKPSDENEDDFKFSPVSSIEAIHELEKHLVDETYAKRFTSYMKKIVGFVGDNCNGMNISYALVDHFFERSVMIKCSWSGASRSSTIKLAIKNCTNILDTFFAIVRSVNMTFSRQLLEHFFKQVTRNAKKRNEAKGLRQPTIHRRAKRSNKAQVKATVALNQSSRSNRIPSTTDDDSHSSKTSNSEISDSEMLVSKVENCELDFSSS